MSDIFDDIIPKQTAQNGYAPDSSVGSIPDISIPKGDMPQQVPVNSDDIFGDIREQVSKVQPASIYNPVRFDYDATRAQKFVNSPHYSTLGYDPILGEAIGEENYAKAQTGWETTKRMIGGFGVGVVNGAYEMAASWKNIGKTLSSFPELNGAYTKDVLEEINRKQREFDDNWHIFKGSNPTLYSRIASGIQSSGHLIGAIGEMAAEQVAVDALIAGSFGAAAPLEGLEAAKMGAMDTELAASGIPSYIQNGLKVEQALNNDRVLGNMWKGIGNFAASASKYMPVGAQTLSYAGDLLRYGKEGDAITTVGRGVHSFINDIRSINAATTFASGNAAGTYQQMIADQVEQYKKNRGGLTPEGQDLDIIKTNAIKAAKTDGAINAYAMLMLEKMAFANLLNSRSTLAQTINNSSRGIYEKIATKPWWVEGAEEAPFYVKQQIKWGNFRKALFGWGSEAGNYGELGRDIVTKGLEFGTFGNVMDAVDKGVKAYYDARYDNRSIDWVDAIRQGVQSQFTKDGADTFISGFLQGALVLGLGGAAFKKTGDVIANKFDKRRISKDFDYNAAQKTMVNETETFVQKANELWKDPLNPIKESIQDMVGQDAMASDAQDNLAVGDRKGFHDVQDMQARLFLLKMIKNGMADMWTERAQKYATNLSQDELCQLMGIESTPENYQSVLNQIKDLPGRVRQLRSLTREMDNRLGNPFNPYAKDDKGERIFKDGTTEFSIEYNNWRNHQIAKDYLVMMKDGALRALHRQGELLNGRDGATGILDMPFAKSLDFSSLFTTTSTEMLDKHIASLQEIITNATAAGTKDIDAEKNLATAINYKAALEEYLRGYADILNKEPYGKQGSAIQEHDTRYIDKLAETLHAYLEQSLITRNYKGKVVDRKTAPDIQEVRDGMEKMLDYYKLGVDHHQALHMLNLVLDPSILKKFQMSFAKEGGRRQQEAQQEPAAKTTEAPKPKPEYEDAQVVEDEQPAPQPAPVSEDEDAPNPIHEPFFADRKKTLEADERALLDYIRKSDENQPLKTTNKAFDGVSEETAFLQELSAAHQIYKGQERIKEMEAIVRGFYDKMMDRVTPKENREDIHDNPRVVEVGNRYAVMSGDQQVGDTYTSVRQANRALERFLDQKHPKIEGTDIRIDQRVYDENGDEYRVVQRGDSLYVRPFKEQTRNKDVEMTPEDIAASYNLQKPDTKPSEEPVENRFDPTKRIGFKPSAGVGIEPYNETSDFSPEGKQRAAQRATELVKRIPQEHRSAGTGFSISVIPNTKYTPKYRGSLGGQVVKKADKNFWLLSYNSEPIGFIENAGKAVYTTTDGKELSITELTPKDIADIFHIPTDGNYTTAQAVYNRLKDNHLNSIALQKLIGDKSKVDLDGLISLDTFYDFNWLKAGDPAPKLGELEGLEQGELGLKIYAVNNYKLEGDNKEYIQNTITDEAELRIATEVANKHAGQASYYTAAVQMANGDWVPIQLTPRVMRADEMNSLAATISDITTDDRLREAQKELSKLFISLPVYSNADLRNVSVRLFPIGIGDKVHIFVRVDKVDGNNKTILGTGNIYGAKGEPLRIDTIDDLLDRLNKVLQSDKMSIELPQITTDNLRYQPDAENLSEMQASVHKDIVKNASVTFKVKDTKGEQRPLDVLPPIAETPEIISEVEKPLSSLEAAFDELDAEEKAINDKHGPVPKVVTGFTDADVEDLGTFTEFVEQNLPDFMHVGQLHDLVTNLATGHTTVGEFMMWTDTLGNKRGLIRTGKYLPYKYHEAFHGIFRMLLTDKEQERLYQQANKENPVTKAQLEEFRNTHNRYKDMDEEELRREYQEEYIADSFDKFSMGKGKPKGAIGAFFDRLLSWIKYIYNTLTGNRLRALFNKVHAGGYKNAHLQENRFTSEDITAPVPKAIRVGVQETEVKLGRNKTKTVRIDRYLPNEKATQLANDITASVILEMAEQKHPSYDKAIDAIMNRYKDTYSVHNKVNQETFEGIANKAAQIQWARTLKDLHTVFSDKKAAQTLKDNILDTLRLQGIKQSLLEEDTNDIDEYTGNPWKSKESVGGYNAMDKDLRSYIASTTIRLVDAGLTDDLGKSFHADGSPIIQAIDSGIVYNGLLKLLSNSTDIAENLKRILDYRKLGNNGDTIAFIDKWLKETGFDEQKFLSTGAIEAANEALLAKVLKGFTQIHNSYTSVILDTYTNKVMVVDAGRKAPESFQFNQWSNAFYQNYYKQVEEHIANKQKALANDLYKEAVKPLKELAKHTDTIAAKNRAISDQDLSTVSQQLSSDIQTATGIYLHPNYIAFSIASGKAEKIRTTDQQGILLLYPTAKAIDIEGMKKYLLPAIEDHKNPFTRPEGISEPTAAETWLLRTAKSNALFDATVDGMSHTNSAGDSVYDYQFPSYNSTTVQKLNDADFIEQLSNNPDTNTSWLLGNGDFMAMRKQLISVGGLELKETFVDKSGEEPERKVVADDINKAGTDFGDFNDREDNAFLLSLYDISTDPGAMNKRQDGTTYYTVPVSLGPIAEKSTRHMVRIPVQRCVTDGKITDIVKEALYSEIKAEADRITRVKQDIELGKDKVAEWIDGYHDGDQRGLKLFSTADLVGDLRETIEGTPDKLEDIREDIYKQIEKYLLDQVKEYKQLLTDQDLLTRDKKNNLLPAYLFKGIDKQRDSALNLIPNDFDHNLAQVYINAYIGYTGISRLMYGDKSKMAKNIQDWWKRMAGVNGQGMSMNPIGMDTIKTVLYPADKFTTIHDTKGEADDGQAYATPYGYEQFLKGMGNMTKLQQSIINKARTGKPLTKQEFKLMHQEKAVLNSLKPLYKDRNTYLKCSVALLPRELTSYEVNGKWYPLPGRELLHNRLEDALKQEENGIPVFIGNKTISKGKTIVADPTNMDKAYQDLAFEYMRLQVATPMTSHTGNKSTQPDKQILSQQDMHSNVWLDGKWQKAGEAIKKYMDAGRQRVLNNLLSTISEVFEPISDLSEIDKVSFDQARFQDMSLDTLMATGMDAQTIELFRDHYNINLPSTVDKSTQLFLAKFIKGVSKERVPMWKMTLRSDTGMSVIRKVTSLYPEGHERAGQPRTWEIVPMNEFKKDPSAYNIKNLADDDKFYGLQVGDYVADRLRDIIPQYDAKGKILYYYSEGLRPFMTTDEKSNGKIAEALSYGFGARTPGTGFQSYRRVHWVDTLPDYLANTAILSRDVMSSTGHDFDVDSLFTAIPDTYMDNSTGERKLYGSATTPVGKFNEYITWLYNNNRQFKARVDGNEIEDSTQAVGELLGIYKQGDDRIRDILRSMKLPATAAEYAASGKELNNGVLVNQGLHAQLALLSGEHVSGGSKDARINRATSTQDIEDWAENMAKFLEEPVDGEVSKWAKHLAAQLRGSVGDINGLLGQNNAHRILQQGADGIGGVANMLQATAVLNQFDKKLSQAFTFGKDTYNEYKGTKHGSEASRDKAADTLAQMHVDASKTALPSRLNLTPEFATLLTHLVKLGLPEDIAYLYPLTRAWDAYAKRTSYGTRSFRRGYRVTPDIELNVMIGKLKEKGGRRVELTREGLMDYIRKGGTDINTDYTLLTDLFIARFITQPLRYMSRFMRFDTGRLLTSWEEIAHVREGLHLLGIGMDDEDFRKADIPVDVRDIITSRHGNMSANYKVLEALETLGKKAFIEQSPLYKGLEGQVLSTLRVPEWNKVFRKNIKHDIISYLSLLAYRQDLMAKGRAEVLDTMDNSLIWSDADDPKSVISAIKDLRGLLKGKSKNYALNSFLNTVLKGKGTDINQIIANTWTRMSEQQQQKVTGAIVDMLADKRGSVHKGALTLFNYLLVKDGGQYKNGSFIRFIPPVMMREWSDALDKVTKVLSGGQIDYKAVFGKDHDQLYSDFVDAYATHVGSQEYIPQASKLKKGDEVPQYMRDYGKLYKAVPVGAPGSGITVTPIGDIATVEVPVDGDKKQWKGAKAVFGNYPKPVTKEDQKPQFQGTNAQKELYQTYDIYTGFGQSGYVYTDPSGSVLAYGITPDEMLAKLQGTVMRTDQPVVPSRPVKREYTPDNIISLKPNEVFVFGSNGEGVHGKGAALLAKQRFGAKQGQAEGLQGQSYAVITKKNWRVEKSSTLPEIGKGLQDMLLFAKEHPERKFLVTKLGSSLAGYTVPEIKELFEKLKNIIPDNVVLPKDYEVREQSTASEQPVVPLEDKEVESVYKSLPAISSIGTQQQYSQYINSIFPNSKVKEIVYHGNRSDEQFDTFNEAGAIFFANKDYAETFKKKHLIAAIVNITNLKDIKDAKFNRRRNKPGYASPKGTQDARDILSDDESIDGLRGIDYSDIDNQTIVVRSPQQVHMLGSKQDIDGFKRFILEQPKPVVPPQEVEGNNKITDEEVDNSLNDCGLL